MKAKIVDVLATTPGMKGREIAKKLGVEKKIVNSLLYHDDSGLFFAKESCWFLNCKDVVIKLNKEGWLTTKDFESLLCESCDLWNNSVESIKFEFNGCAILLGAIARILSLVNQLAIEGKRVTLDFTECTQSFTYLCRVGLFEILDTSVEVVPEIQDYSCHYGQNNKVMEFVSIESKTLQTDLPAKLKKSFVDLAGQQHANSAFAFISEFINNIIEHSHTPIPGVAALQVYGKENCRKKVQTVFSDSGKGIVGTLRPVLALRYPKLAEKYPPNKQHSDILLLKEVLVRGGISGANDPEYAGRGLGLKVGAKQAAKFDATVRVRQETYELVLRYRNGTLNSDEFKTNLMKMNGTHICFDFFIN
ncbi:ATP-binding protein [Vibrio vulnificus]|uniref:ATP-binding protein n=1 Tax=Vibrio TaxID=662 RepID=UPI00115A1442|nr:MULTISPECIES: ATP-binding protein [Vibrio]MCU8540173.1 ATP-binding protein [Vibrio vulnificus]MCU8544569.1 ATP-binding protein [Vibrio vulnificus]MCZ5858576.1 ATP-binding protein [Vibrio parahaemolyticus]MCZ6278582.1 ATP-binding protein [Vibrio parahaemolyticus]MRI15981.1 ATP-binding protein [Vibrio cholerae]